MTCRSSDIWPNLYRVKIEGSEIIDYTDGFANEREFVVRGKYVGISPAQVRTRIHEEYGHDAKVTVRLIERDIYARCGWWDDQIDEENYFHETYG